MSACGVFSRAVARALRPTQAPGGQAAGSAWRKAGTLLAIVAAALALAWLIRQSLVLQRVLGASLMAALGLMLVLAAREGRSALWSSVKLLGLMAFHTVFFALYEQSALSLTLFTARNVDRSTAALLGIGDGEIAVTFFQAIDPLLNLLLGGAFVSAWAWLSRRRLNPPVAVKFGVGLLWLAAGLFLLSAASAASPTGAVSPWALVGAYALFVLGEQFTVPMGFSAVAALSPKRYLGFFMGSWLLSAPAPPGRRLR